MPGRNARKVFAKMKKYQEEQFVSTPKNYSNSFGLLFIWTIRGTLRRHIAEGTVGNWDGSFRIPLNRLQRFTELKQWPFVYNVSMSEHKIRLFGVSQGLP